MNNEAPAYKDVRNPQPERTPDVSVRRTSFKWNLRTGQWSWLETKEVAGRIEERTCTATKWEPVERTNCWCCSCGVLGRADASCREHGFWGRRPCTVHGLDGEPSPEGVIPRSIETYVANRERGEGQ